MASANPLWGAPRVHGELLKLGIEVSERTVSRLMPKKRNGPSQTWKTFSTNHVGQLVSVDFFTVPTLQLRVLFVFVLAGALAKKNYGEHRFRVSNRVKPPMALGPVKISFR